MTINRAAVLCDRTGTHLTISLAGELDCASANHLFEVVGPFIDGDDERVTLDVSRVTFCGSAGLTLFVQLHHLVQDQGGSFTLLAPSPPVMRSIELCRLDEVFQIARPLSASG
ncbi:MAG: STAS domain-containing protein [Aquihabitans sp.]